MGNSQAAEQELQVGAGPELEDAHEHGWYLLEKLSLQGEIPSKVLFVKEDCAKSTQ